MDYKLEDIIDVALLQNLQEKLNEIYSFPSAIIDNDGKLLTAVAWQDVCTKFHRMNPECEKECLKSDQYIKEHLHEANPALSYQCPHGLVDNATPIIIDGKHYGNFFTGQFFLEKPDLDFFKKQAKKYEFDEKSYLEAVEKVPIWTREKLHKYLDFIKGFIEIIAGIGLKHLNEIRAKQLIKENEEKLKVIYQSIPIPTYTWKAECDDFILTDFNLAAIDITKGHVKDLTGIKSKELYKDNPQIYEELLRCFNERNNVEREMDYSLMSTGEQKYLNVKYAFVPPDMVLVHTEDITRRKQTEAALKASNERFQSVADHVSAFIAYVNVDTLKYEFVNKMLVDSFGMPREKIVGSHVKDIIGEKNYQFAKKYIEMVRSGKKAMYENTFEVASGRRWIDVNYSPVFDTNGKVTSIVVMSYDVTERKQAVEAIKISEAAMKEAEIIAKLSSWEFDFRTRKNYWSDNTFEMYGLKPNAVEPTYEYFRSRVHPDDLHLIDECVERAKQTKKLETLEMRITFPDGSIKWFKDNIAPVFEHGELVKLKGINLDITERKLAEQSIRESEEKFRTIFMNSLDGYYLATVEDGRIMDANLSYERLVGYSREEFMGKTSQELNLYCDFNDRAKMLAELEAHGFVKNFEVKGRKKNGDIMDVSMTVNKLQINNQHCILGILKNITLQKQTEAALRLSELRYSSILETAMDGFCITDSEGWIIDLNDIFCRMSGFSKEELLRMKISELEVVKPREEITKHARQIMKTGEDRVESRQRRKDGSVYDLEVSIQYRADLDGQFILFFHDITERKQRETELHKLHKAIEESHDIVFITDTEGVITFVNASFTQVYGYTAQEVVGKVTPRVLNCGKTTPEMHATFWKMMKRGEELRSEYQNKRKDGTLIEIEGSASAIFDEQKNIVGYLAIQRDITQRKREEQELIKTNRRLEQLNSFFVDRENRMIELKQEINELCVRLGEDKPYDMW